MWWSANLPEDLTPTTDTMDKISGSEKEKLLQNGIIQAKHLLVMKRGDFRAIRGEELFSMEAGFNDDAFVVLDGNHRLSLWRTLYVY